MKDKDKKPNNEDFTLNEPAATYGSSEHVVDSSTPSYVLDDYKVGMEQYKRGEYTSADSFIRRIKSGL